MYSKRDPKNTCCRNSESISVPPCLLWPALNSGRPCSVILSFVKAVHHMILRHRRLARATSTSPIAPSSHTGGGELAVEDEDVVALEISLRSPAAARLASVLDEKEAGPLPKTVRSDALLRGWLPVPRPSAALAADVSDAPSRAALVSLARLAAFT